SGLAIARLLDRGRGGRARACRRGRRGHVGTAGRRVFRGIGDGHREAAREASANPARLSVKSWALRVAWWLLRPVQPRRRCAVNDDAGGQAVGRETVLVVEDQPRVDEHEIGSAWLEYGRRVVAAECTEGLVEDLTPGGADQVGP